MKYLTLLILILVSGCQTVHPKEPMFWLGVITPPVAHELSHVVYMEIEDIPYQFHGTSFRYQSTDRAQAKAVARAGFVGQTVTSILVQSKHVNDDFRVGYNIGNAVHLISYPIRHGETGGDLSNVTMGEWSAYSAYALGVNFIDLRW